MDRGFGLSVLIILQLCAVNVYGGDTAWGPSPSDKARNVEPNSVLIWSASDHAASHDVCISAPILTM